MNILEIERLDDGNYNISGNIYTPEEAAKIRDFIEVEEMNDHIHEHGHDAYREKYNGEEP
jgi:hypothetical protein|tara:strand:- start:260 stop:439 length:180 start_codon:yes stop_codon:yes gene_type:complete